MKISTSYLNKASKLPIYVATNAHKKASPKWIRDNTELWLKKDRKPGYGNSFFGKEVIVNRQDFSGKTYKYKAFCTKTVLKKNNLYRKIHVKKTGYSNKDIVYEQFFLINPAIDISIE